MKLEELVGIIHIHEQVLQSDAKDAKVNDLSLKSSQKMKKSLSNKIQSDTKDSTESVDIDEEAHIGFMVDVVGSSMLDDSDNEVYFTEIDSLRLAYQEVISNNNKIASVYKAMKRNYKNTCKEFELMQQEKANLDDLSIKNRELLHLVCK